MNIDHPIICIRCGLPADEVDLAGCTRDTDSAHDFQPIASRPFRSWDNEAIVARMARASMKGSSASATAEHFAGCPTAGSGTYVHRLYVQKAQKRLGLARELARELWLRSGGDDISVIDSAEAFARLYAFEPEPWNADDELTIDEAEAIGFDGTGRDMHPRFPLRYSDLSRAQLKRLTDYRKAHPFSLR